ncbi:hypothetical protein LC653_07770 [Nostoc sp. CHAB 5784]|nr:hypothetical protein [Nostoc mirabile CHAB5784]
MVTRPLYQMLLLTTGVEDVNVGQTRFVEEFKREMQHKYGISSEEN